MFYEYVLQDFTDLHMMQMLIAKTTVSKSLKSLFSGHFTLTPHQIWLKYHRHLLHIYNWYTQGYSEHHKQKSHKVKCHAALKKCIHIPICVLCMYASEYTDLIQVRLWLWSFLLQYFWNKLLYTLIVFICVNSSNSSTLQKNITLLAQILLYVISHFPLT